jgi:hypothetical protein
LREFFQQLIAPCSQDNCRAVPGKFAGRAFSKPA